MCKNQNTCALRHGFNTMYHGIMVALEFEQNELRTVGHVFLQIPPIKSKEIYFRDKIPKYSQDLKELSQMKIIILHCSQLMFSLTLACTGENDCLLAAHRHTHQTGTTLLYMCSMEYRQNKLI